MADERARLIEDEAVLLADSGELPEVAYHAALWQLCGEPDGPRLSLTEAELRLLQEAALSRCQRIILRDRRIWRGPQRSSCNWQRYLTFCRRIGRQHDPLFQAQVAAALTAYLAQEEELLNFARQLGGELPESWMTQPTAFP